MTNGTATFTLQTYPKKNDLEFYAEHFNSVKINNTFYRTANEKTVKQWKERVPDNFVFTFKASQYITHTKKLDIDKSSYSKFYEPLAPFAKKTKKHCILLQLPAGFKKNFERLETFLKDLPDEFRHAIEFREETWFDDDVYKLLRKHNMAVVLNDSPKKKDGHKWPMISQETASFFYIRFHGSHALYTSRYTDAELQEYAKLCREKLDKGLSVYAYFNNDAEGHAPFDAQRLREMIVKK